MERRWFVAKDVDDCIEHSNVTKMCELCRDKDKVVVNYDELKHSADFSRVLLWTTITEPTKKSHTAIFRSMRFPAETTGLTKQLSIISRFWIVSGWVVSEIGVINDSLITQQTFSKNTPWFPRRGFIASSLNAIYRTANRSSRGFSTKCFYPRRTR